MKLLFFGFAIFLFSLHLFSKEVEQTPFEITKEFRDKLEEIKTLDEVNYPKKIDSYRLAMEKYIDHKKKVCSGEFSILIMEEGKQTEASEAKTLSRKERQLCFRELKALQITYVNNMFIARERYLGDIHKKQIQELNKTREEIIQRLQQHYE